MSELPPLTPAEKLFQQCGELCFQCYGYSGLFDYRAGRLGRRINLLKVFGLLVPAVVGVTYLSRDYATFLSILVWMSGIIGIIQFAISLWAVIYKWDDELTYCFEASQNYSDLSDKFSRLAELPPNDFTVFQNQYDMLRTEFRLRQQQDSKHGIKDWERRRGMRIALRQFQRPCVGCSNIPLSLLSTECDVCGKYSYLKNQMLNLWLMQKK